MPSRRHEEVVANPQRKVAVSHVDEVPTPAVKSSIRRTSFNMHAILHPGKDYHNRRNASKDRDEPRSRRNPLTAGLRSSSKSKDAAAKQTPRAEAVVPAKFHMIIESPPLVFYGSTANSTGAILSGRLRLDVTHPDRQLSLTSLDMTLSATISNRKPVAKDCPACAKRVNELNTWNFLSEPRAFHADQDNHFPFSFLLPGHLPATTRCHIGAVEYQLQVHAKTARSEDITLTHPVKIDRAVPPGPDKTSVRIFPPTRLTARLMLPPIIHPIGVFPIKMVLSGVVDRGAQNQTRWRLRQLMWRIEEHITMISPACPKHGHKVGGDGKALQHQEDRTVGSAELKGGWKTDFDTEGGEITLEFDARLSPSKHPACDIDSSVGLDIRHNLVVESIIAEEICPNKNTSQITPTGPARVLRMQFAIIVTERAGMGISWDEEMPPVYDDVPDSPPGYGGSRQNESAFGSAVMEDYVGPELECVDLERVRSENPDDPPTYRQRDPSEYADVLASLTRRPPSLSETPRAGPSPALTASPSPRVGPRRTSSHFSSPPPMNRSLFTEDDLDFEPPERFPGLRHRQGDEDEQTPIQDFAHGQTS